MPDISAFAAALSSLKAAKDIGEAMIGLRDAAAFQSKLLEFQSKLIDANNAAFAARERSLLLQRIRELEEEMAQLKAWNAKQQRYELHNVGRFAFAYVLKKEERGREPPHWVCTNCFDDKRVSIMQYVFYKGQGQMWTCPSCKSTIEPGTSAVAWPAHATPDTG